jgi:flagellar hook protein FlgE
MKDMADFSIPRAAMATAADKLNATAGRIARAPESRQTAPTGSTSTTDEVDLSAAAVDLLMAQNTFEANTSSFRVMDEVDRAALDMAG